MPEMGRRLTYRPLSPALYLFVFRVTQSSNKGTRLTGNKNGMSFNDHQGLEVDQHGTD